MSYIVWFFKRSAEGKGKALKDLESIFLPLPQWDAAAEQDASKLTAVSASMLKLASETAETVHFGVICVNLRGLIIAVWHVLPIL